MKKSQFMKFVLILFVCSFVRTSYAQEGKGDRAYWVEQMIRIVNPVLSDLASDSLKIKMPVFSEEHRSSQYLEAFGRVICGIAPWLELPADTTTEGKIRKEYRSKAIKGLQNAVNPRSKDYMQLGGGVSQTLVDAAYLAQGLLRAPSLWESLDSLSRDRLVDEMRKSRQITPGNNNWLLFASMVETFLLDKTGSCDEKRLFKGVDTFMKSWYHGDGMYGDGKLFAMDYYNSYVIHPMLTDILFILEKKDMVKRATLEMQLKRIRRFAEIQERFISPEGTYPVIGRTITCRFGAFHALSDVSLLHELPETLSSGQVRSALTAVIKKQLENASNFDDKGYMNIGFTGIQPSMAESYISAGSPYHCVTVFLPLGLPVSDEFWTSPFEEWTNLKAWNGKEVPGDHSLESREQASGFHGINLLALHISALSLKKKVVFIYLPLLLIMAVSGLLGFYLGRKFGKKNKKVVK